MTITIRNLKRSATGRESIRERDIEAQVMTIGRAEASDLDLRALSVLLNHGEIHVMPDGKAVLTLLGQAEAMLNGRLISGSNNKIAKGDIIKIAPYTISVDTGERIDDLILTVEQVESPAIATIDAKDEATIFSLRRALPGKRLMSWVTSLVILGLFLWLPVISLKMPDTAQTANTGSYQPDLAWNTGDISLAHSNLQGSCNTCHENPFEAVRDETCLECHTNLSDHAAKTDLIKATPERTGFHAGLKDISETFGRPVDRCASCHVEHNGEPHILPIKDQICADCHRNLNAKMRDTTLKNVSDFGTDHPQFQATIITAPSTTVPGVKRVSLDEGPKGFSGLKFAHKDHLDKTGGVARMARQLPDSFAFSDGVDCADCHRIEAGGALFEPVNMRQDCAVCHDIIFETDDGYDRTLRHGEPEEVIASMRDFYQAKALGNIRDAERNALDRRRPGRTNRQRELNRRELAFKQAEERTAAKVKAIFSDGGACFDCHVIDAPSEPSVLDYQVRPISVSDQFYFKSKFDHESHEIGGLKCGSCHEAETSLSSDDILLPKIETCRDCHIGEESYRQAGLFEGSKIATNCLTCHGYHIGPNYGVDNSAPQ